MSGIELIKRAGEFGQRTAVEDRTGNFTYADLLRVSRFAALNLLGDEKDLEEKRVAFLVPPEFEYVALKLGVWMAGGVSVPLGTAHSPREIKYVIEDSCAETVVFHPDLAQKLEGVLSDTDVRFQKLPEVLQPARGELPGISEERRAMIIYTSGTTSKPKGVVSTHLGIKAQINSMTEAWEWTPEDSILNVLPLHHLHGILNVVLCCLWSGARCVMMDGFNAQRVWKRLEKKDLTLFMAVPTIYSKLIDLWDDFSVAERRRMRDCLLGFRLMVSGSAALPVSVLEKWKEISGQMLLERYGMTEIGMALSNPYRGERLPGCVGFAMPGVEVGIFDENDRLVGVGGQGEIRVKGEGVFLEYWGKPRETESAFCDGWFKTGDIAFLERGGSYRILGRESVDIIKSGGYKISALEIEEVLMEHPLIMECAVVGVADPSWGERVGVALMLSEGASIDLEELRDWASDKLARYKLPTRLLLLSSLPRNSMGKVAKNRIKQSFQNSL
ncbi:MAG: acyl-CoA synthetase [Candidatus Dadabacteria bacterium]|nr:acyl-CoA synthetase [Candidatus Dadabacteria bacterium]MDE0477672.1 acyl-CoA synthetase [Candidatus Dadabacteria bacterium]